jgi:hypothetical protein
MENMFTTLLPITIFQYLFVSEGNYVHYVASSPKMGRIHVFVVGLAFQPDV